jgi:lipoprotein-anchoring transpeptidase ErfK/SrfK
VFRRLLITFAVLAAAAPSAAQAQLPASFPAAGDILDNVLVVRKQPQLGARVVTRLPAVRPDRRLTIVHAVAARTDDQGRAWVKLALQMRPNNTRGWALADAVALTPTNKRIVVDLSSRSLKLFKGNRVLVSTRKVGIGKRATPTPLGYYYVAAGYRLRASAYGAWALETTAYSPTLTDWPGGGKVGIHGTSNPGILPGAVSHGCVRVPNAIILKLKRLAPVGTAIIVRR